MGSNILLEQELTIVVNSCDSYEDLWFPFFTLLKRYWNTSKIRIILNTETKDFSMDGLDIDCVHSPKEYQYGRRMLNVLSQVKTKYVLPLLDDFFLRSPVDEQRIIQVIEWMEQDPDIVYFNCDCNAVYVDWEVNRYPGFRRIPPGNDYIFSMQAAIWKTDSLMEHWYPDVNPWEWETMCNAAASVSWQNKYYCVTDLKEGFLDYGFNYYGMGVYRGKWVAEDVVPLFAKEGICVDFTKRGFYDPTERKVNIAVSDDRWYQYRAVSKCLGKKYLPHVFLYEIQCGLLRRLGKPIPWINYFDYLQKHAQKRFLKRINKLD